MKFLNLCFACSLVAGAFVCEAKAGFATGTDDEANYYFPQTMAEWCSINYDSKPSTQAIEDCLKKIGTEYNSANDEKAAKAQRKFKKMKMEALINAFITAHEAKKKFANDKAEEVAEEINIEGEENNHRTQTSGNGEINKKEMEMDNQVSLLRDVIEELDALDSMESHNDKFVTEEEKK